MCLVFHFNISMSTIWYWLILSVLLTSTYSPAFKGKLQKYNIISQLFQPKKKKNEIFTLLALVMTE